MEVNYGLKSQRFSESQKPWLYSFLEKFTPWDAFDELSMSFRVFCDVLSTSSQTSAMTLTTLPVDARGSARLAPRVWSLRRALCSAIALILLDDPSIFSREGSAVSIHTWYKSRRRLTLPRYVTIWPSSFPAASNFLVVT